MSSFSLRGSIYRKSKVLCAIYEGLEPEITFCDTSQLGNILYDTEKILHRYFWIFRKRKACTVRIQRAKLSIGVQSVNIVFGHFSISQIRSWSERRTEPGYKRHRGIVKKDNRKLLVERSTYVWEWKARVTAFRCSFVNCCRRNCIPWTRVLSPRPGNVVRRVSGWSCFFIRSSWLPCNDSGIPPSESFI